MTAPIEKDGNIARIRAAVNDFEEVAGRAGATLERLAKEGDDSQGSGQARVAAVLAGRAGIEADLVNFALRFDAGTGRLASAFEALKTGRVLAYGGKTFPWRRKVAPTGIEAAGLSPLLTGLAGLLAEADQALQVLVHLTCALKRCHAGAETTLEDVVARRRAALAGLEAAQKASEERRLPLTAKQLRLAGCEDDAVRAPLEEEGKRLEADLKAAQAAERECLLQYRSLDDLAALLDLYMGALNGQRAACNAVMAKLSVDVERCVLLGRALQAFARTVVGRSEDAEGLFLRSMNPAGPAGALLALAEKGWLNHAETLRRKAHADLAFALRFGDPESGHHPV